MPVVAPSRGRWSGRWTDAQVQATLAADLETGMSLRHACLASGLNYLVVKKAYELGKSDNAEALRKLVAAARAKFIRRVQQILLHSAEEGVAGATERLIEQAADLDHAAAQEEIPTDPVDLARYRLRDVQAHILQASGIAYVNLVQAEARLLEQLRALPPSRTDASPDEWRIYLEGDAASAPECDLEVYVNEYLKRTGARLVHERTG